MKSINISFTILTKCGISLSIRNPKCFVGSNPSAATLITIASILQSIISCSSSF